MDNYITDIEIEGLFGDRDIRFKPDPKVNILAGINGSGKSTVLRCLYYLIDCYKVDRKNTDQVIKYKKITKGKSGRIRSFDFVTLEHKESGRIKKDVTPAMAKELATLGWFEVESLYNEKINSLEIQFNNEGLCGVQLLSTFDLLFQNDKRDTGDKTELDVLLHRLIYGDKNINICYVKLEAKILKQATTYYRKGDNEKGDLILKPIDDLLATVNDFLSDSNKKIVSVDDSERRLQIVNQQNEIIEFNQLSTGEKQILIILLTTFLQEKQPTIFLLDEPEVTLHIKWQENLIDAIFKINPNIQLFIATHASSIFFNGYQDKLILMKDISFPMKSKEKI